MNIINCAYTIHFLSVGPIAIDAVVITIFLSDAVTTSIFVVFTGGGADRGVEAVDMTVDIYDIG